MPRKSKSRYALLGMLNMTSMSGYEIKNLCDKSISHFWSENYSNIYPLLKKMEAEGAVTMEKFQQESRPDKKVYTITDSGRQEFKDWLHQIPEIRKLREELLLQVFYGNMLSPKKLMEKIEHRKTHCEDVLHNLDDINTYLTEELSNESQPEIQSEIPYWKLSLDFGLRFYTAELEWCDAAMQELKRLAQEDNSSNE